MRRFTLGIFRGTVNYLMKPKGRHTWHYRRGVPTDLRQHYPSRFLFRSLKTRDSHVAAQRCAAFNRAVEEEFARLRQGLPKRAPVSTHALGQKMLRRFGIELHEMDHDPYDFIFRDRIEPFETHVTNLLFDALGSDRMEQLHQQREPLPLHVLPEAEQAAYALLTKTLRLTASAYPREYLLLCSRENDRKFYNEVNNAIRFLLDILPDKSPGEYHRYELRDLIAAHLQKGLKTTTIERRLSTLRAMFNKVSLELEFAKDRDHVFQKFDIPRLGEDSVDRLEFTAAQLQLLRNAPHTRLKEALWLIHLMMDTGLRIKECCGLRVSDVSLQSSPYVVIQKNSFRRLKNKNSQRYIPLVGASLQAIVEALEQAGEGPWLFPRYVDVSGERTKNSSASATVNIRLRRLLGAGAPTCHGFRHTMQTRLRNVGCPIDVRDELGGWRKSVSEQYGSPTDIHRKARYLSETIDVDHGLVIRRS